MLKLIAFATLIIVSQLPVSAQSTGAPEQPQDATTQLSELEPQIEAAVVRGDVVYLDGVYATDFRFTHGTGLVQNKTEWLDSVKRARYIERKQESLEIEQHGDVALVSGRLLIKSRRDTGESWYGISYLRVYKMREGRWQMLSHRTTSRWDLQPK